MRAIAPRACRAVQATCLALALACLAPEAFAQDAGAPPRSLEEVHADFVSDPTFQHQRPEKPPQPITIPDPPPGWLVWLMRMVGDAFAWLGPLMRWLFYGMIALVLLAIAYFLFGQALDIRPDRRDRASDRMEVDEADRLRPEAAAARSLLEEADALARGGRYAEAVHLLLFRSIEDIQSRREGGLPPALTAREIGALGFLPDAARRALGPIITVVERSFFGGRPVDAQGWQTARASYESFAFGEAWR